MVKPANLCIRCKGKNLCGLKRCPLLPKFRKRDVKEDFFGKATSVFVGRFGYPNVSFGPVGALSFSKNMEDPKRWFGRDYEDIVGMRSNLLRGKNKVNIFSRDRFIEDNQELALAKRETDIEMKFKKKPSMNMKFSNIHQPMGPSGDLRKFMITENPKLSLAVEKVVGDELKAEESSRILYKKGEDVYKITNVLSSGSLGLDRNKKLVPTRWSITATDDMVFKILSSEVKDRPSVNEYMVYKSSYLDNNFLILLMPGNWEFENFEAWAPGSFWYQAPAGTGPEIIEEYEPFGGRSDYADKQAGGYYASRLGVVEGLKKLKRQARVVVFREVYEGYMIPMGVWVVRETVRDAFNHPAKRFDTLGKAMNYIDQNLKLNIQNYQKDSKILRQKRLSDF